MIRHRAQLSILLGLLTLVPAANPCSWAVGYFNQVTRLRGTVVGVNNGDVRHPFRWMRQRVRRDDAKLTLYHYRWPAKRPTELLVAKVVKTDERAGFDFGELPKGHYTLRIEIPSGCENWFDVEVAALPKRVDQVRIDVSPIYPDCTGGHEFRPVSR